MLRDRAEKAKDVNDEMWEQVDSDTKELVKEYLEVNTQLSKRTKVQYESGLKHFFWWVHTSLNGKPLNKISKRDFMRYMSFMQNRGMSSNGMKFKRSAVSAFCTYIENIIADDDENYATFRNFTKGIPSIPKNQVYNKEPISKDEYELMKETLLDDENYLGLAWLATAYNVGARRSEIIQFKSEILDYPIPDGQNYIMSHTVIGKGQAGGKPIEYMVNLEALKYMKLWVEKRGYEHEYIFTTTYGGLSQMSSSWANTFCRDVLSDIVGRRINPHIFKASCVSNLLSAGVDMKLVSKYIAHHEDISTTSQFYDLRDFEEEKNKIFNNLSL